MDWCQNEKMNQYFLGVKEALCDSSIQYGLVAVILIFLLLLLLRRRQPKKILAYQSENGRVLVSRSAILELVQTACTQIDNVYRPTVQIRTRRGVCHLKVGIKLESGGKLKYVENTLQKHLRQSLTETLGIEQLGAIDITATGFKGKKVAKPVESTEDEDNLSDYR